MLEFITKGALFGGIRNYIWIGALLLIASAITTVVLIADNRDKRLVETGREAGASSAVIEGQRDVLGQVERANNATAEIRSSDNAARHERCLRNSTPATRANCKRFAPLPD